MKVQIIRAFKSYFFVTKKVIKRQKGSAWNFLQPPIHPLIFLWTLKGFISPESFLNFFLNLYIPQCFQKSFKFIVLRLQANKFVSQKIESVHFNSCLQAKLSPSFYHYSPGKRKLPILPNSVFWRSIFSSAERGGENYGVEKFTKIQPRRVLVTNLINSTIFATFTFSGSVLLCRNLASSVKVQLIKLN